MADKLVYFVEDDSVTLSTQSIDLYNNRCLFVFIIPLYFITRGLFIKILLIKQINKKLGNF